MNAYTTAYTGEAKIGRAALSLDDLAAALFALSDDDRRRLSAMLTGEQAKGADFDIRNRSETEIRHVEKS